MKTSSLVGSIVVDLKRCLACKSCELACAKAHAGFDDIVAALDSGARLAPRIKLRLADGRSVPVQCQHCDDAPCVAVCSTGALYKEEATGRVLMAEDKCIGCKACVRVCPFGAVVWDDEDECIIKCDLCEGILEEGEEPYCVRACPTGALVLIVPEEATSRSLKEEYDALIKDDSRTELAGPQVTFTIDTEKCICCGRCAKGCPVNCITGKRGRPPAKATEADKEKGRVGEPFKIDEEACVKCGTCFEVCPAGAVDKAQSRP